MAPKTSNTASILTNLKLSGNPPHLLALGDFSVACGDGHCARRGPKLTTLKILAVFHLAELIFETCG
jgi:hypothetical protein